MTVRSAEEFKDFAYWQEAINSFFKRRYPLPTYTEPCTVEAVDRWVARCGLTDKEFLQIGNYKSIEDFIKLNPEWPIYAIIGLCLEESGCNPTAPLN